MQIQQPGISGQTFSRFFSGELAESSEIASSDISAVYINSLYQSFARNNLSEFLRQFGKAQIFKSQLQNLVSVHLQLCGDAPTQEVISRAVSCIRYPDLIPDRFVALSEGGVALYFFLGGRITTVEFYNDGSTAAASYVKGEAPTVIEFNYDGDKARIMEFLTQNL